MSNEKDVLEHLLSEIRLLNANIVELTFTLKEGRSLSGPKIRATKPSSSTLTQEEMSNLQQRFEELYELWLAGKEMEVQRQLEAVSVDEARKLADANNLNVTSKMPKDKILNLI